MMATASVGTLEKWGRTRLSKSFFLRDFLHSEIADSYGLCNFPDDVEAAVKAGTALCENLLEPLQERFGRIAIRSGYRSPEVNQCGNDHGHNCASNDANAAGHIWDSVDREGHYGATACIVVPRFLDHFSEAGDWKRMAWWIHDHLPYSSMEFYKPLWAFNLTWNELPKREIYNWLETPRWLTRPSHAGHEGSHAARWAGIEVAFLQ